MTEDSASEVIPILKLDDPRKWLSRLEQVLIYLSAVIALEYIGLESSSIALAFPRHVVVATITTFGDAIQTSFNILCPEFILRGGQILILLYDHQVQAFCFNFTTWAWRLAFFRK